MNKAAPLSYVALGIRLREVLVLRVRVYYSIVILFLICGCASLPDHKVDLEFHNQISNETRIFAFTGGTNELKEYDPQKPASNFVRGDTCQKDTKGFRSVNLV